MTIRGTRNLFGEEANKLVSAIDALRDICVMFGYQEFIPSILSVQQPFIDKAGKEIVNQLYAFDDKMGRPICLIPEVTAVFKNLYKIEWEKTLPKPVNLFYATRCYRYERPQLGRPARLHR